MRISDWSSDVCSSDLSITHFSSARSASSVFGGNSSNDRVRPASSRSGIRAMGCKRYFVVVPTAQTTLGGSDLAGHDAQGARAGFALHARTAARQGRGHVLGRKVDGGLRAAADHPHHDTTRSEAAVHLPGEEERVVEDERVEAAV